MKSPKQIETYPWLSSAVIATIISAIISGAMGWITNQNDVSAKYVEIAVGILSAKSSDNDKALREWAIEVINKYADS